MSCLMCSSSTCPSSQSTNHPPRVPGSVRVHLCPRHSLISLKRQQSRLHENPLILCQSSRDGCLLSTQLYQQHAGRSRSLLRCDHAGSVFQRRSGPVASNRTIKPAPPAFVWRNANKNVICHPKPSRNQFMSLCQFSSYAEVWNRQR